MVENVKNQGIGSIVGQVNQLRADELLKNYIKQDINLEGALKELQQVRDFYAAPEHVLGSMATKHGEIAEHIQVGFENADKIIIGETPIHTFDGVGRTAPEDYLKNGMPVQSKFVQNHLSLDAIQEHLNQYPDFLSKGGTYDIPRDYFDKIQEWRKLTPTELRDLPSADGGDFARKIVKKVQDFENTYHVKFEDAVHPAQVKYDEAQLGKVDNTVDNKEQQIKEKDKAERKKYELASRATLKEGLKVAGIAAIIDGVISFGGMLIAKMKQDKKIGDFTEDDWKDIFKETGIGVIRGGATGGGIYALTNLAGMPAPLAAGCITAAYGIVTQAIQLGKGKISIDDFIYNIQQLSVNAAVSGLGAFVGQTLIPIPVAGAVIGSLVATKVLGIIRENLFGGDYYGLVNQAKYQNELSSMYRNLTNELVRSQQTFENMVQTYFIQTQRYQNLQSQDKMMDSQLNSLLESI